MIVIAPQTMDIVSHHICEVATEPSKAPLFPNLHSYHGAWFSDEEFIFHHVPFMGGQKLHEFSVQWQADHDEPFNRDTGWTLCKCLGPLYCIIPTMAAFCPNLEQVRYMRHVLSSQDNDDYYQGVYAFLTKLPNLHSILSSVPFHTHMIIHLSMLPDLPTLLLSSVKGRFVAPASHSTPHACYFASLCDLTLSGLDAEYILPFVETLQETRTLRSITFELCSLISKLLGDLPLTTQFTVVSRPQSLENILWKFPFLADSEALYLTSRIVSLLYPLRALKSLRLEDLHQVCLNDEDLKDMASAWPQLEVISLHLTHHIFVRDRESSLSIGGIAVLFQACPRLHIIELDVTKSLELPSDLHGRLPLPLILSSGSELKPLILTLGHGSTPFTGTRLEYEMFALFISALFPSLEWLVCGHRSRGPGWTEVSKLW